MHTVIETPAYLASAKDENVTEEERNEIVAFLAGNPDAGVPQAWRQSVSAQVKKLRSRK
jgi:hypothetical protein